MNRLLTIAFIALTAVLSVSLYRLAEVVRGLDAERAAVQRQLVDAQENIRVLEAEWAYVTRPEVLQERSTRHLTLSPVQARQIARFADLPRRDAHVAADTPPPPAAAQAPAAATPPGRNQ